MMVLASGGAMVSMAEERARKAPTGQISVGSALVLGAVKNAGMDLEIAQRLQQVRKGGGAGGSEGGGLLAAGGGGGGGKEGLEMVVAVQSSQTRKCCGVAVTRGRIIAAVFLAAVAMMFFASMGTNFQPPPSTPVTVESGYSLTARATFDANFTLINRTAFAADYRDVVATMALQ